MTATLVTLPVAVPLPLATEQVCVGFVGCVNTVTAYVPPLGIWVLNMNVVAPAAMVFVPCRLGRSHSSDEWAETDAIALGAEVLLETVLRLDQRGS